MNDPIADFRSGTSEITETFKKELGGVRTSRPTPAILDAVRVEYYGQKLTLNQVGSISVEPPRDIVINVWDSSVIPEVLKAIESAPLGLSAAPQGNTVRVHLPEISVERRKELVKLVGRLAEDSRIKVRNLRDDVMKAIEVAFKSGEVSEDMKFKLREKIQEETERVNKLIETALAAKMTEIEE
ncbi:MAG TPA: ribosome recycling factor [Candidatus Paceibacterota bacterium]|nr:ribosome recycling factor [Candidatus Paceibacterota bacterium]